MQTILGSNGIIGTELAKNLPQYTDRIRLVSRTPHLLNESCELFAADLTDPQQTMKAVEGSDVAYLTAGLRYNIGVWQAQWPVVMQNVLDACRKHGTRLVFFDNVYMYGKVEGWMTETTRVRPISKKGEVRASIAEMVLSEVQKGNLQALIARAADFYGPHTDTSFVNALVFNNQKKGKKAQWMMNVLAKHSFTYTPDAGKATAILGNSDKAMNQIWHLPTNRNVLTGLQFIEEAAIAFDVEPAYQTLPKWMLRIVGLFTEPVRESIEMLYQYDSDYLFDSSKFEKTFDFTPTTYQQGIRETAASM